MCGTGRAGVFGGRAADDQAMVVSGNRGPEALEAQGQ